MSLQLSITSASNKAISKISLFNSWWNLRIKS